MDLILTETSKELIDGLDTMYHFYKEHKSEHLEITPIITIDHILIATLLSLSEAPLPELNKVYLDKSKIDGLGVFAKENLIKGEIISMYPSDIVRLHQQNHYYEARSDQVKDNNDINERYAYKLNDYCSIMGDQNLINNTNLVGHFINDGSQTDGSYQHNQEYNIKTHQTRNCKYYPYRLFVLIVTTKNVEKDEELLVPYGIDYWSIINNQ
jgi:SET domain-containing protein